MSNNVQNPVLSTVTPQNTPDLFPEILDQAIDQATESLIARQNPDGHMVFALEADATIPAEYIMLMHYLDEIDAPLQARIARYLRRIQRDDGSWPLFHAGTMDLSVTVKAYYALKLAGDSPDAPHMVTARRAIHQAGGAARTNVFTRIALCLFGQIPWRAVPVMPVEIMILPKWFPFHMDKISYWSRTVIAPLLILMARRPQAINPHKIDVTELFLVPPFQEKRYLHPVSRSWVATGFRYLDHGIRAVEPFFPHATRARATRAAELFMVERLNGLDGLGAIFPAMANAVMAMTCLGYAKDDARLVTAKAGLRRLVVEEPDGGAYVQPCLSPVWDTSLAAHALLEVGDIRHQAASAAAKAAVGPGNDWLADRQICDVMGDWKEQRPTLVPGGWAFQYNNPHYPDVDDTAVVVMALDRAGDPAHRPHIARAVDWIIGMQSDKGGWGAFDANNEYYYLNYIPFADHGALLDPPTTDVTARCVSMLAQLGRRAGDPVIDKAMAYIWAEQETNGSWFGRWGTNYIYGTWSVLCAVNAACVDLKSQPVRRAVDFLIGTQRPDGGWGEDGISYYDGHHAEGTISTASQTAWALLGLMAVGDVDHPAVKKGIRFLLRERKKHGLWDEETYTAVGFPRVFYLRYHGYRAYFPLMALARYKNLTAGNDARVAYGF